MCEFSGSSGDVRLAGGQSENEGRVEVCVNGGWGTVTDDGWSTADGEVLCRQLGYRSQGTSYLKKKAATNKRLFVHTQQKSTIISQIFV